VRCHADHCVHVVELRRHRGAVRIFPVLYAANGIAEAQAELRTSEKLHAAYKQAEQRWYHEKDARSSAACGSG
jgi:hypothetical protein